MVQNRFTICRAAYAYRSLCQQFYVDEVGRLVCDRATTFELLLISYF